MNDRFLEMRSNFSAALSLTQLVPVIATDGLFTSLTFLGGHLLPITQHWCESRPPNHQGKQWDQMAQMKPPKLTEAIEKTPSAQWKKTEGCCT